MACRNCDDQCYCTLVAGDGSVSVTGSGSLGSPYAVRARTSASSGNAVEVRPDGLYVPTSSVAGTWQAYTTTWGVGGTGVTSQPVIGNGTKTARYCQIGDTVFLNVLVNFGSTTSEGGGTTSSYWTFTVPVAVRSGTSPVGSAYSIDTGQTRHIGAVYALNTTTLVIAADNASAPLWGPVYPTGVTWGNGDALRFSITYEAA